MRMIQAGDGPRLALEALAAFRLIGKMDGKNLDGDDAIQAGIPGAVDLAHATRVEEGKDLVGANLTPHP